MNGSGRLARGMDFTEFCFRLKERLGGPLPAGEAHNVFRARPVGKVRPAFKHSAPPRPGAVIILLYEENHRFKFPLIKRPDYDGAHGGQMSLPGGKLEAGEDAVQAALRECEEEIGVPPTATAVLGTLSDYLVIPSNYLVRPVVASIVSKPVFKPDPFEVSRIVEAQLDDLLEENGVREKEILAAGKYRMIAPHFEVDNEVVWGATAMILNEFRVIVREVQNVANP